MTAVNRVLLVTVLLTVLVALPVAAATALEPDDVIELRVMAYASDPANVRLAGQTAIDLLTAARVHAIWRICAAGPDRCAPSSSARRSVLVRLLPLSKLSDPSVTGEVVKDSATSGPAVLVYLKSEQALTLSFQQGASGRSHPALATLSAGHLVGLTLAHEVGHVLGLPHSRTGIMKPRWDTADIIAARGSQLTFQPNEVMAMGIAIRTDAVAFAARQ